MSVAAFSSVIGFFQINSYLADKKGLNGFWIVWGIAFALAAGYCLYRVIKEAGGGNS